MKFLYYTIFLLSLISCKSENNNKAAASTGEASVQTNAKAIYPSLPESALRNIWDNGEMIDYIFHNHPFSMNQTEQNSIRSNLTYIAPDPVMSIPQTCKPFARQFYQVGGDIVLESDVYFGEGCKFYVFFEGGKAKYANQMAPSGVSFFNNMVNQAMKARQNGGQ